jgi:protoporphyrinogen oxidase
LAPFTDASPIEEAQVLILGGGLAGLSAASILGENAIVLESGDRPGGLVRTECFSGYWFDRVIHLLYFPDAATEQRVRNLLGADLKPCPPTAWVECSAGTTRFPLQMHLGNLESQAVLDCVMDFITANAGDGKPAPQNFEELLLRVFGQSMCDIFFFPYNRKVWKRALNTLAPSRFQWNIARPDLRQVLRGALNPGLVSPAYNSAGWYPRPPRDAGVRGMEVLSRRLTEKVVDLRTSHIVEEIDVEKRIISVRNGVGTKRFRFARCCLSTIPLPEAVAKCRQAPQELIKSCGRLKRNRVLSAAFSILGPRPTDRGHWRYYTDETIIFTRLVYMHEFDQHCAPEEGWSLLAEITQPAEFPPMPQKHILKKVQEDLVRTGALPRGCRIIDAHLLLIDPAYVVFSIDDQGIAERAQAFLSAHEIITVGRYGRWEYSSMGQVMRDGFELGEAIKVDIKATVENPGASASV